MRTRDVVESAEFKLLMFMHVVVSAEWVWNAYACSFVGWISY